MDSEIKIRSKFINSCRGCSARKLWVEFTSIQIYLFNGVLYK